MPPKRKSFEFYEKDLKRAKYVVAPMVDASELAWRMLSRRHGAQLCYTPMLHSGVFVRDERYRIESLQTCPEDRPLIVQFCANDPETFKRAVEYTVKRIDCDAVDLNLGCPQVIAKRGHFGSFLQDEWELLRRMVSAIHDAFDIPITCKTRIFPDVQKSVDYAKMLESAGCQLITVHGRTREQKGPLTGLASWEHIAAVAKAVRIPVLANGNIQRFADIERCIEATGADGVMSAEGNLYNPALFDERFADVPPEVWTMCFEYLDLVDRYPCPLSYSRGHVFKILHRVLQLPENFDVREIVAKGQSTGRFREAVATIQGRYEGRAPPDDGSTPVWVCQPYVRMAPEDYKKKMLEVQEKDRLKNEALKRSQADASVQLSKKRLKKMERNPNRSYPLETPRKSVFNSLCASCVNPAGLKCNSKLCRTCCRRKCFDEELGCPGHKIQVKSKREAATRQAKP